VVNSSSHQTATNFDFLIIREQLSNYMKHFYTSLVVVLDKLARFSLCSFQVNVTFSGMAKACMCGVDNKYQVSLKNLAGKLIYLYTPMPVTNKKCSLDQASFKETLSHTISLH
jgi:hypothetical protein